MNPRAAFLAQASALRSQADALEALALALPEGEADDPLLDCEGAQSEGILPHTARTWIRSGRLEAHQAERGRYVFRRSALRRAIESAPAKRRERATPVASDLAAWEREADASLRLIGGSR